jgi:hypothetical protein
LIIAQCNPHSRIGCQHAEVYLVSFLATTSERLCSNIKAVAKKLGLEEYDYEIPMEYYMLKCNPRGFDARSGRTDRSERGPDIQPKVSIPDN